MNETDQARADQIRARHRALDSLQFPEGHPDLLDAVLSDVPWLLDRLAESEADVERWRQSNAELRARLQSWYDDPEKAAMQAEAERDAALDRLAAATAEVERLAKELGGARDAAVLATILHLVTESRDTFSGERNDALAKLAAETERADVAEAAVERVRWAHRCGECRSPERCDRAVRCQAW